jgi:hypothetical protein
MDFTFEATGSDTNLNHTLATTPQTALLNFFTAIGLQSHTLGSYLSPDLSRTTNACQINWTDVTAHLDGSNAGSPYRTDTFTLPAANSATALPGALAAVVAYRANYGGAIEKGPVASLPTPDDAIDYGAPPTHMGQTRPRARMRSRLFFGPCESSLTLTTSGGLLYGPFKTDLGIAMAALESTWNSGAANQFNLVVWSKRDAAVHTAKNYFVSEAFGVVSRRSDPSFLRVHNWINVP